MARTQELYDSFRLLVLEDQWSIEGWIHAKQVTADELDAVLGLVSAAMIFFRGVGLRRAGMFTDEASGDALRAP